MYKDMVVPEGAVTLDREALQAITGGNVVVAILVAAAGRVVGYIVIEAGKAYYRWTTNNPGPNVREVWGVR